MNCEVIALSNLAVSHNSSADAYELSVELANEGYRTLVVDCTKHGKVTKQLLARYSNPSLDQTVAVATDIFYVLKAGKPSRPINIFAHTQYGRSSGIIEAGSLDLIPSTSHLADLEDYLSQQVSQGELPLMKHIDRIRPNYNFILIDFSPCDGAIVANLLPCSDCQIMILRQQSVFFTKTSSIAIKKVLASLSRQEERLF